MPDLKEITQLLVNFRNERDWEQFHDAKNLAIALAIESAELNELFLWKTPEACDEVDRERISDELADVFVYALLLAERYNFDIREIILNKMKKNAEKYPVSKAKGNAKKYNEL
jgi:NTP pyrophosphatase (non-canonical NTP hydrolase)